VDSVSFLKRYSMSNLRVTNSIFWRKQKGNDLLSVGGVDLNGPEECPQCKVTMEIEERINTKEGWLDYLIYRCPQCKKRYRDSPTLEEI